MSKPDKRTPQEDVKNVDAVFSEYAKQPTLASRILSQTPTSFVVDTGIDPPPHEPLIQAEHAWDMSPEDLAAMEQKLAAMVDARLASLALRVDWLYRYTVGNRDGKRYLVPPVLQRGEEFPA